jgi:uncharacterized protein YkwD
MNQTSLLRGLGAGLALFLASCASDLDTTRVAVSHSTTSSKSDKASRLHDSINQYRQSIGKPPLRRHAGLDRLAQQHCEFMAKNRGKFTLGSANISHYGFEERALTAQRAFSMQNVAENVAGGFIQGDPTSTLVNSWAKSSKHVFNLKGSWDATGVGVYTAPDGMVYATQFFATENRSHMALTDRMRAF